MIIPAFLVLCLSFPDGMNLVGAARRAGPVLRLTPAAQQTAGAAWLEKKQQISSGFDTSFQFQLTNQGGLGKGADGFAFVLQNAGPSAIAGRGSSGGFALGDGQRNPHSQGIPRSIAVFFDTYRNGDAKDPSDNYIAVCTNGRVGKMHWPPPRLGFTRHLNVFLKDGKVHEARIVYQPPVIKVFLDGEAVLTTRVDLSTIAVADGRAYVGFTASTGSGYQNHDILNWSFSGGPNFSSAMVTSDITFLRAACLPDRNLCTPDHAIVEQKGSGSYHIVLPANLAWGASVPGSNAVVSNARGIVCREDCIGPADGLISKMKDGRVYFSVNGGGYEGFFEFDVDVR